MAPFDPSATLQRLEPWLADIDRAARAEGEQLVILCAIASRETEVGQAFGYHPRFSADGTGDWMARVAGWAQRPGTQFVQKLPAGWSAPRRRRPDGTTELVPPPYAIPSDGLGWGRGLFQLDACGTFRELYRPAPWPVDAQAVAACRMLQLARRELAAHADLPLFGRAVLASYNAGTTRPGNLLRAGLDPDQATTPGPRLLNGPGRGDYGADVLDRAEQLRRHSPYTFAAVHRFPPGPGSA